MMMIIENECITRGRDERHQEVGVKSCMNNFIKLVYCKVFLWCGHRGFKPALVNSVHVYVYENWTK